IYIFKEVAKGTHAAQQRADPEARSHDAAGPRNATPSGSDPDKVASSARPPSTTCRSRSEFLGTFRLLTTSSALSAHARERLAVAAPPPSLPLESAGRGLAVAAERTWDAPDAERQEEPRSGGRGSMTEVEPVLDFASSGRTGRRNALPDILGSPSGVTPTDLPMKLAEMSLNSDRSQEMQSPATEVPPPVPQSPELKDTS
uniref:Fatty acid binding protein 3 n=1 Tax=Podarcis muralis TaxID=64176 RepID=A0A670JLW6_PODMU